MKSPRLCVIADVDGFYDTILAPKFAQRTIRRFEKCMAVERATARRGSHPLPLIRQLRLVSSARLGLRRGSLHLLRMRVALATRP
jgi:hypothetical protein